MLAETFSGQIAFVTTAEVEMRLASFMLGHPLAIDAGYSAQ